MTVPISSISGMGNPDMQTPQHIVDKLVETVNKPRVHRYSASKGIPGIAAGAGGLLCSGASG